MQKHELDYPDFYPKLYSLLTLETLHADYREDFFKKIDMFLSSSYLASYIAAAFAKKYVIVFSLMSVCGTIGPKSAVFMHCILY